MPVTTASAAVHITPVVIKTFFKHTSRKGRKLKNRDDSEDAFDDIFYDEAFHIVKAFIELGTKNTVESLQAFTNTHIPAPYWSAVAQVLIPLSSCNQAADKLVEWFGPDDLQNVVGGERWWQVRGLEGVDAEWITEKEYLGEDPAPNDKNMSESERTTRQMEHLERVMLYVHGGAFFWGSINTHRYQVIRYARKFKGRAFAVNYRKAPQYPWPCPLQDVLAAYFYLTDPPPGAPHKPVPPSKLVLAGDSAGASLCISTLTVLRDLGLPLPAGAVLISPWVDLTHSFPSVMKNTETDIIPPHGFIHKPSPTWPPQTKPEGGYTRVIPTKSGPPPKPGHADTLQPDSERKQDQDEQLANQSAELGKEVHAAELKDDDDEIPPQKEMLREPDDDAGAQPATSPDQDSARDTAVEDDDSEWEPKPPKVLMENPNDTPLELLAQIQLYATTEQLSHPLVSPVLQGSLGNLCPLYIIAGDGECLRDEIIYLAHKAARPQDYPARKGVLREGRRQKENAERFQTPTKVHLQVFDDMCHVLTVFTFIPPAKYAYRSIAQFVKHATGSPVEDSDGKPFPELLHPPSQTSDIDSPANRSPRPPHLGSIGKNGLLVPDVDSSGGSDLELYQHNVREAEKGLYTGKTDKSEGGAQTPSEHSPDILMIRERVDVFGKVRPMEDPSEIEALRMKPQEIGLIKEAPVKRWLAGQEKWDRKYKSAAHRTIRKRRKHETKAARLLQHAREQGLLCDEAGQDAQLSASTSNGPGTAPSRTRSNFSNISALSSASDGEIQADRRWGPLDLANERPPATAIAGRRDTHEAVALLKKNIYHKAPATHNIVPKLKTSDAIRAAFDPHDHPIKAPQQSVSEQQVHNEVLPIHGLKMWQGLVDLFMRKSKKKVVDGTSRAASTLRATSDKALSAGNEKGHST